MNYRVKTIIEGVEVTELSEDALVDDMAYTEPSISAVKLTNVVTQNTLPIGDVASDCLTFTLNNPYKPSYDGNNVELWISEVDDGTETILDIMAALEDEIGVDTSDEGIDVDDMANETEEDEEPGEDMSAEEIADVEDTEETNNENQYEQLEGEADTVSAETTDEAEEPEWVKLGSYFVYSQVNGDNSVKLTCYDNMAKLNGTFIPSARTATLQDLFDDLRTQIVSNFEVTVDSHDFDNVNEMTWDRDVSYRDALGYMAGLIGGYIDCDEDGELSVAFATTDADIRVDTDILAYKESSAGEILIVGIGCDQAMGGEENDYIYSGIGDDIIFNNPFMTQDNLDDILSLFESFRVNGASLSVPWDASMRAGGSIRLMEEEEYKQYLLLKNALEDAETDDEVLEIKTNMNSLGRIIFICSQTITFGGKAITNITSAAKTVSEQDMKIDSLLKKSLKEETSRATMAEEEAAKVATNYLHYDVSEGLYVTDDTDTLDNAVKIDSDSVDILKGGNTVATFEGSKIELGKNSKLAEIVLCGGRGHIDNKENYWGHVTAFYGGDQTAVGDWHGASESYALFRQGFSYIGCYNAYSKYEFDEGDSLMTMRADEITIDAASLGVEIEANMKIRSGYSLTVGGIAVSLNGHQHIGHSHTAGYDTNDSDITSQFVIEHHNHSYSNYSADETLTWNATTWNKSGGYYPIGIVGFDLGKINMRARAINISNRAIGSCKINCIVRTTGNGQSGTAGFDVLWVKI